MEEAKTATEVEAIEVTLLRSRREPEPAHHFANGRKVRRSMLQFNCMPQLTPPEKNSILIRLAGSYRTAYGREEPFAKQTLPQKIFSAIWVLEAEVNNGGFSQYFFNSSRETSPFVVEACHAIGARQAAAICSRAITCAFPNGIPGDLLQMRMAAADFPDTVEQSLNEIDCEFYKYPDDLTELLFSYVAAHPEEFGDPTQPEDLKKRVLKIEYVKDDQVGE